MESLGCLVGCSFVQLRKTIASSQLYWRHKNTHLCTPSGHHLPTSIPIIWIAYSELNSPSRSAGAVFCRIRTCCSGWANWLVGPLFNHSGRARRLLVRTYIEDIKTHTTLYAIRPPPSNLHSYPEDRIQWVKLTVRAGGNKILSYRNMRKSVDRLFAPKLKT